MEDARIWYVGVAAAFAGNASLHGPNMSAMVLRVIGGYEKR